MAITPNNNEAFLREVDEELRRDQLATFGQRYGRWVIVGIVVALALLAGFLYWRHHQRELAGAQGEQLAAAYQSLGANQAEAAAAPLATLAKSDRDAYRALARFTQADIALQRNDLKGAAAKFAEVANDATYAPAFRDLAQVRRTAAEYDTLRPQAVIERLRGLAVPESPWFGSAGEMVATAYLRMNRRDLAGRMFGQIARDPETPESLRQRAVQMAGVLGVDAVAPSKDSN